MVFIIDEDMLFGYYDLNKSNLALDNLHPFTSIDSMRLFHQQRANVIYPESMFRPWTSINNYDISSRSISPKQYDLTDVNGEVFVMDYLKIAKTTINRKWYQFMYYDHSLQMTAPRYKGAEYDRYMIGDDGFIYDTQPAGEYSPPYSRKPTTNQWRQQFSMMSTSTYQRR